MTEREAIEWVTDVAKELSKPELENGSVLRALAKSVYSILFNYKLVGPRFSYKDLPEPVCAVVCNSFGGCACTNYAIQSWRAKPEKRWDEA